MNDSGTLAYHLAELKVAQDAQDPRHISPPPIGQSMKVLDVGCGIGQTLLTACPASFSVGLDVDLDALAFGNAMRGRIRFVCGRAESLPFPSGFFDVVIARVSLPYTDVAASLAEIRRVLKHGGFLWAVMHRIAIPAAALRRPNLKSLLYFCYVFANSMCLHLALPQFSFLGRRMESFQTERGMKRALSRAGFREIEILPGRNFILTASVGAARVEPGVPEPGESERDKGLAAAGAR